MRDIKITVSVTNRNEDSLRRYLHDIGKIDLLDASEEVLLARKIKAGDRSAEERLIKANLRFVVSCAKKYQSTNLSLQDLISEGNFGLIKAARLFDETRGFKFISYAVWWIRQAMITAINEYTRIVRLPMNQQLGIAQINNIAQKLEQELERDPSLDELAEAMDKTPAQVADFIYVNSRIKYLDDQLPGGDSDNHTLMEHIPSQDIDHVGQWMHREMLSYQIDNLLLKVSSREQQILKLAFGLKGHTRMENEDIAAEMDLSKERVRQIIKNAIDKLGKDPQIKKLKQYVH
ncbi:sigma-70 family RNA polymerase sigma factor [Pedobacter sp. GR22-6]|uniref:sigma-70 family RNA polymerase sigma factor n=1 Tax=Pedobacter sp. GR22-6 TaxID=3127957 RepID=UPI00307DFD67